MTDELEFPLTFRPQSERHGVKALFHLAKEDAGGFHLQAILFPGVPLVNGGPQAAVSSLKGRMKMQDEPPDQSGTAEQHLSRSTQRRFNPVCSKNQNLKVLKEPDSKSKTVVLRLAAN